MSRDVPPGIQNRCYSLCFLFVTPNMFGKGGEGAKETAVILASWSQWAAVELASALQAATAMAQSIGRVQQEYSCKQRAASWLASGCVPISVLSSLCEMCCKGKASPSLPILADV